MPRTDNDTWNLATSVGATATMVAAARAIATKADNGLTAIPENTDSVSVADTIDYTSVLSK